MKKIFLLCTLVYLLISTALFSQYTTLLNFAGATSGSYPRGTLISDGTFLYGMGFMGGTHNYGTIFKIMPDGTGYEKLMDFTGVANGRNPNGALVFDGTFLYGTTELGGTHNYGCIFKIKPDGTGFQKLIDFTGSVNGAYPMGSLISDGNFLYGMTQKGGTNFIGTIFKIMTDGTGFVKLLDFAGSTNGCEPYGSLFSDGTFLYGMTLLGGANDLGTIFKIMPDGSAYTKLFDFAGATNGKWPGGSLISDGIFLYGMTEQGGTSEFGTIFKIMPNGTGYVKLLDFNGEDNGKQPFGDLILDGTFLYGLTQGGGNFGKGTIFRIMPDGSGYAKLFYFTGPTNGSNPHGSLISDGSFLYGMTNTEAANSLGSVFKFGLEILGNEEILINNQDLSVYPNPASDNFTIKISSAINNAQMEIYNAKGQKVYNATFTNKQRTIDSKQFSTGIYFVKVSDGEKVFTKKLIIE